MCSRPSEAPRPYLRIFAILAGYRERLVSTDCKYGCPLGRLALEIEAENQPAHDRIAANFSAWTAAVRGCLEDARSRFPRGLDLDALATFVLTTMEGGVLQSRSYRKLEPFDQSVAQLRHYFGCLLGGRQTEKRSSQMKTRIFAVMLSIAPLTFADRRPGPARFR